MRFSRRCLLVWGLLLASAASAQPPAATIHWSLQPRRQPAPPAFASAADREWSRTWVDAYILAALRKQQLRPSPEADRGALIRRVAFDLTGLPPTPEEVERFRNDPAPDAYERLVDRLLASSHYGERWGQHWLDVVRFAETEGFEYDRLLPGMWRYRDYVIRSFNQDKPYDRFLTEQIAGDELESADPELQIASGFHRLGPVRRNAGNPDVAFSRIEVLTERTDILGTVFMGLTVGCARCHDHKFDEISQVDYYRLQAFLAAADEDDVPLGDPKGFADWKARTERARNESKKIRVRLAKLEGDARLPLEERLRQMEQELASPAPVIHGIRNIEERRIPVHVLKRGDPDRKGPQVGIRMLSSLVNNDAAEMPPETRQPRTALARWLTAPAHPLTARVLVNRIWQYHFGRGIVETPNDFGVNGGSPSHPDLLDALANEFVADGWRMKPLHRLLLLSSTYRQASRSPTAERGMRVDPDNRLLWQVSRRRLTAEEVRDAMLTVAGTMRTKAGGPSIMLPVEADMVNLLYDPSQWLVTADPAEHQRRSVYLIAKRNLRLPFAETFDQPDLQTSCAKREASTHALQALELLNGPQANQLAEAFAQRLEREAGPDAERQVELAYRLATGRAPNPNERERAVAFLLKQPLREFALALFSLNAFLYVN